MEESTSSHPLDNGNINAAFQAHVESSNPHIDNCDPLQRPATPIVCKYVGRPDKFRFTHNNGSVVGHCKMKNIDNFEDHYLREFDVTGEHINELRPELDALLNYEGSEAGMYKYVAKLFTKAGLLLCEEGEPALSLYYSHPDLCSKQRRCRMHCYFPVSQ